MSSSKQASGTADHPRALLHSRIGVVIPTYNASSYWKAMQAALDEQGVRPEQVLIIDSSSTDDTAELVTAAGYQLETIEKSSFRHGATRQLAAELLPWAEVLVYLTQDALPTGRHSLSSLLQVFDNPRIGACYGRQLPRAQADRIEQHARLYNYPDRSDLRTFECRKRIGFKAAFCSNSFAAYRRTALEQVGGFSRKTIVSEEVTVTALMLMAGWEVFYQAEATVVHSHPLTVRQEFCRYFDIGVHHGREHWLLEEFGTAGGEGLAFVRSEIRFLLKHQWTLLPLAMLRSACKWCSYHLGVNEVRLPQWLKERLSAQPDFWTDERAEQVAAQAHVTAHISQKLFRN